MNKGLGIETHLPTAKLSAVNKNRQTKKYIIPLLHKIFRIYLRMRPLCFYVFGGLPTQEDLSSMSIVAFISLLVEHPDCASGTLEFRGTLVKNYWSNHRSSTLGWYD